MTQMQALARQHDTGTCEPHDCVIRHILQLSSRLTRGERSASAGVSQLRIAHLQGHGSLHTPQNVEGGPVKGTPHRCPRSQQG